MSHRNESCHIEMSHVTCEWVTSHVHAGVRAKPTVISVGVEDNPTKKRSRSNWTSPGDALREHWQREFECCKGIMTFQDFKVQVLSWPEVNLACTCFKGILVGNVVRECWYSESSKGLLMKSREYSCSRILRWQNSLDLVYGMSTISRLLRIIGLFCRISSLL